VFSLNAVPCCQVPLQDALSRSFLLPPLPSTAIPHHKYPQPSIHPICRTAHKAPRTYIYCFSSNLKPSFRNVFPHEAARCPPILSPTNSPAYSRFRPEQSCKHPARTACGLFRSGNVSPVSGRLDIVTRSVVGKRPPEFASGACVYSVAVQFGRF
jgi:hypothetical protein